MHTVTCYRGNESFVFLRRWHLDSELRRLLAWLPGA